MQKKGFIFTHMMKGQNISKLCYTYLLQLRLSAEFVNNSGMIEDACW